jgi:DNA polymerase-1
MKKIYLIDANSFIYRMFYWVPEFITKKWEYVNAIFGIARFFLVQMKYENPDYLIFVKDAKWRNFRHDLDENYKATRDKMPDNLKTQMPIISDMVKKMWIPIIEIEGYEADDVIWTLAEKYDWEIDIEVDVLTWDKDLYSLVSNNVNIYDTMKKKKFGIEETIEKFGVKPEMIIDYLAIVWDKADNIPWIDWFWPKKAIDLINIVWKVENIYELLEKNSFYNLPEKEVKNILIEKFWEENTKNIFWCFKWKTFEKLINSKDNAFLSKKLATIELDVELNNFNLEDYKFTPENYLTKDIEILFRELEFSSLLNEEAPKLEKWNDLWLKVRIIDNDDWLEKIFKNISNFPQVTIDTETTSLNIVNAKLVWVSVYLNDDNIFYINRMHNGNKVSDIKLKEFLVKLFELNILIIGHNIKYDLEIIELFLGWCNNNINNNNKGWNSKQLLLWL